MNSCVPVHVLMYIPSFLLLGGQLLCFPLLLLKVLLSEVLDNVVHVGKMASLVVSGRVGLNGPVLLLAIVGRDFFPPCCSCRPRVPRGRRGDELGVCDIDESVLVSAVLKEVSVEASLFRGFGVQSVDLLPVLGARLVLVDEAEEEGLVALLGDELVDKDGTEEGADGEERSGLEG